MKRLTCWATRAAAVVVLALVVSPTLVSAQEPTTDAPASTEESAGSATPEATDTAQPNPAATATDPSGCKGLEEKPCRKNNNCYWIIPKEPDKAGNVKPPYCHKRGNLKKKASEAAPPPAAAPPAEQTSPATEAPDP